MASLHSQIGNSLGRVSITPAAHSGTGFILQSLHNALHPLPSSPLCCLINSKLGLHAVFLPSREHFFTATDHSFTPETLAFTDTPNLVTLTSCLESPYKML